MPGPEGMPLPPPSLDAVSNTSIPVPAEIQLAKLPDLNQLPNMDEIAAASERQREAEDAFLGTGPSNAREPRLSEFPMVNGVRVNPGEVDTVEAQKLTADMSINSAGLTAANNPRTAVRLGGPDAVGLPFIPKPETVEVSEDQSGLIGGPDNPVPKQ